MLKRLFLSFITYYQSIWSPDHSPRKQYYPYGYCRFTPTCSEYSYQAIDKYGIVKGGILSLWRIVRCNPLSKGGLDPVK